MNRPARPEADWGVLFVAMFLGPSLGTGLVVGAGFLLTGFYQAGLLLFTQPDALFANLSNPDQFAGITGSLIIVLMVTMLVGFAGVPAASIFIFLMHFFSKRRPIDGAVFGAAAGGISIGLFMFQVSHGIHAMLDADTFAAVTIFMVAGGGLGWLTGVRAYRDGRAKLEAESNTLPV